MLGPLLPILVAVAIKVVSERVFVIEYTGAFGVVRQKRRGNTSLARQEMSNVEKSYFFLQRQI